MTFDDVTACLVTRGDTDMGPIFESLPYDDVVLWDNSVGTNFMTYGRFAAAFDASSPLIYFQDDDCIQHDHAGLLARHLSNPNRITAVYGHGDDPGGYGDIAIFPGGCIVERDLLWYAFDMYLADWPEDRDFYAYCDYIFGCIVLSDQVRMPFEILELAHNGKRLVDEPWAKESKARVTARARDLRDRVMGP